MSAPDRSGKAEVGLGRFGAGRVGVPRTAEPAWPRTKAHTRAGKERDHGIDGQSESLGRGRAGQGHRGREGGSGQLDAAQAKHRADGLLRDLGAAFYADHQGRSTDQTTKEAERLIGALQAYEAEYGPLAP